MIWKRGWNSSGLSQHHQRMGGEEIILRPAATVVRRVLIQMARDEKRTSKRMRSFQLKLHVEIGGRRMGASVVSAPMDSGTGFPSAERKVWRRRHQSRLWLSVLSQAIACPPTSKWVMARIAALPAPSARMVRVPRLDLRLQAVLPVASWTKTTMKVLLTL